MKSKLLLTISLLVLGIFSLTAFTCDTSIADAPTRTANIQQAAARGLSILEKSGYTFTMRSTFKCASCHNNNLTSMAAALARQKAVPTTDSFIQSRIDATVRSLQFAGNPNLIRDFLSVNFAEPYFLLGLYADRYPASIYTDISVDYLMSQATPDGRFLAESGRVPLETGDIHLTAMAIHAIQLYASPAKAERIRQLMAKTRTWLENARPVQQQEVAFQLLGLYWCGSTATEKEKAASLLKSMQNADGGWSQLPTLGSDAYATGQSLYSLCESGTMRPDDPAYQRGIEYLLKTQDRDGAWIVMTRSYPIQPFFNSDFPPYDENQFISAAGSNWAVMALLKALPDKTN